MVAPVANFMYQSGKSTFSAQDMNICIKIVAYLLVAVGIGCAQMQKDLEAIDYASSVYSKEKISRKITDIAIEIKKKIESNWVQPKSAANGMVVKMSIRFNPDGSVRQSRVIETSGFEELDTSALAAVKVSEPFKEIKDLSSEDFDRYFSIINFHFMVAGKQ